jgi:predicted membrane-bound spermidine synthase
MPGEYRQWLDLDLYINGELQFCGEDAPFSFAEAMAAAQQASRHMIDLLHAAS